MDSKHITDNDLLSVKTTNEEMINRTFFLIYLFKINEINWRSLSSPKKISTGNWQKQNLDSICSFLYYKCSLKITQK